MVTLTNRGVAVMASKDQRSRSQEWKICERQLSCQSAYLIHIILLLLLLLITMMMLLMMMTMTMKTTMSQMTDTNQ